MAPGRLTRAPRDPPEGPFVPVRPTRPPDSVRPVRPLAVGSFALAAGAAFAALAGPLVGGLIDYHVADDVLNQVMGADAAVLALVVPAAVWSGILAVRRHPAAPALALGPAGFAVYTYAQLAVGGEFVTEPGNSERFFLLFLALFVTGELILVGAWRSLDPSALPSPGGRLRTVLVWVLFALAAFLALGLHLPGIADTLAGPPYGIEYIQSPTVFWVVKLMDLGIVVPLAVATGLGVRRRARWADRAVYGVIGWGALLGSAVAGMAIVMQVNGDPAASAANTIVFGLFALAFLLLAGRLFLPAVRSPVRFPAPPEGSRRDR